jgi:predicted esterase
MSDRPDSQTRTEFVHRWIPHRTSRTVLLLLHGTGGNEDDLVPLAPAIAPGASVLSPRGRVLEHGMPRFFRRLAEGVFDIPDLIARTEELAGFIADAAAKYGFDPRRVVALGNSNGANIAGAMLLLHPHVLAGAILLRPMVPLEPATIPDLGGKPVQIVAGRFDELVTFEQTEALAALLRRAGASVDLHWTDAGHRFVRDDLEAMQSWLEAHFPDVVE